MRIVGRYVEGKGKFELNRQDIEKRDRWGRRGEELVAKPKMSGSCFSFFLHKKEINEKKKIVSVFLLQDLTLFVR